MSFGERLRELREDRKLKQIDIANVLGISDSQVGNYESDHSFPRSAETIKKLAEFFHVSTDYLFGMKKAKNYNKMLRSFKEYNDLTPEGQKQVDDFIQFLKHKQEENP